MNGAGLILEGGGMRGVFTGGVLEAFMENDYYFPYVIGVSAGACHGSSYAARQRDRNRKVSIDYVTHPDYISLKNLVTKRELFGMDLLFNKLPNELVPFDYETFAASPERFVIGTTDCYSGKPVYFEKGAPKDEMLQVVRASSSLPFMAAPVDYQGMKLMDGGIADPIPLKKALDDGVTRPVIILTRPKGYRKAPSRFNGVSKFMYKQYPGLVEQMETRWQHYNETLDLIETLEAEGEAFVIRPQESFKISRAERNPARLSALYEFGIETGRHQFEEMMEWLGEPYSILSKA
ncbi:patatin family protein [Chryseomicrobium sp. FSL W7-1435]|uniref:patatin-like phospholipase family protein n=1 Tax=Chryseomicrobium sp. FSL W7-1435 TaxID=2921704 RepID=UPI00315AAD02